jgi:aminoglycoside phosphotransferase (APT) family kinase protein
VRIKQRGSILETVLKAGPVVRRSEIACEAAALAFAETKKLAAPRVLATDLEGTTGSVALLMTKLLGSADVPSVPTHERLHTAGVMAARLHQIPLTPGADLPLRLRHMPWVDFAQERRWAVRYQAAREAEREAVLDEMLREHPGWDPDEARRTLSSTPSTPLLQFADERIRQLAAPEGDSVFVHGDLWQGNTMWLEGAFVGIIDWEAAGAGHHGVDLGSLRWDAAILFGRSGPAEVLSGWEEAMGREAADVAYWDIVAALNTSADMAQLLPSLHQAGRNDLDPKTLATRQDAFLRAALDQLDGTGDSGRIES